MKIGLIIALLFAGKAGCQKKSDLYLKVEAIVKYNFNLEYKKPDTAIIYRTHGASIPYPTYTLIIVNNHPATMEQLNNAVLADVKNINVIKDKKISTAIWGQMGSFGAIVISGNKKLSRKVFKE